MLHITFLNTEAALWQCLHILQGKLDHLHLLDSLELIPDKPQPYPFRTLNTLLPSAECGQLWPKFLLRLARLEMTDSGHSVLGFDPKGQGLLSGHEGCSSMKVGRSSRHPGLDGLGQRFFSYAIRPHEWVEAVWCCSQIDWCILVQQIWVMILGNVIMDVIVLVAAPSWSAFFS